MVMYQNYLLPMNHLQELLLQQKNLLVLLIVNYKFDT